MDNINKKTYWKKIFLLDNFFISQLLINRRKMYQILLKNISIDDQTTILDVGTAPSIEEHENYLVHQYKWKKNLTCLSNQDCSILKSKYNDLKLVKDDGRKSSLEDSSFDIVYSNATIEHVGNSQNQMNFIQECVRLSKSKIFISMPNRYFPIDFHSKIPLIHMLPKNIHRRIIKFFGESFFGHEENLNLLGKKDLILFLEKLNIKKFKIIKHKLLFLTSNIILIIEK